MIPSPLPKTASFLHLHLSSPPLDISLPIHALVYPLTHHLLPCRTDQRSETLIWLPSQAQRRFCKASSTFSSLKQPLICKPFTFLCVSCRGTFGAGLLAVPNAFKHSGLTLSIVTCALAGITVFFTLRILLECFYTARRRGDSLHTYGDGE